MYKELRYFNGEKVVRVVEGQNNVKMIIDKEDHVLVYMESGLIRSIRSSYTEIAERYETNPKVYYSPEELGNF
ncbi:hypothetical protein [Vagococcus fluvialis]|uniref:hypothetical protein n=1 Tax=Vagococcus fluvialis TaxID=2738 RepID=UPI003B5A7C5F